MSYLYPGEIETLGTTTLFPSSTGLQIRTEIYLPSPWTQTNWDAMVNRDVNLMAQTGTDETMAAAMVAKRLQPVSVPIGTPIVGDPQSDPRGTTVTYSVPFEGPEINLTAELPGPQRNLKADIKGDQILFTYRIAPHATEGTRKVTEAFRLDYDNLKSAAKAREQQMVDLITQARTHVARLIKERRRREDNTQAIKQDLQDRLNADLNQ